MQEAIQCRKNLVMNEMQDTPSTSTQECTTQLSREQGVVRWDANNGGHLPGKAYQCPAGGREGMPLLLLVAPS